MNRLTVSWILVILLTACGPQPQDIVDAWQQDLNKGDIESALSHLADDVVVSVSPPGSGEDGVYKGKEEVRGWYETIVAGKGTGTMSDCQANGDTFTCVSSYEDEGLKSIGVDFIEGSWVAVVHDGKIQSYTFTISPESLAKFPPPPEPTPAVPATSEVIASKIEDIAGIWDSRVLYERGYHHFKPDGTLVIAYTFEELETNPVFSEPSKYWFEGTTFHVDDFCGHGTYEITMTIENDQPIKLHFKKLEDPCEQRKIDWKVDMRWVKP